MSDPPADDFSAAIADVFASLPYAAHLCIELETARDGHAIGTLPMREAFRVAPDVPVAHSGAAFALADTVAGAAMVSRNMDVTPTVNMRMEYLRPATTDLTAEATVVRNGAHVAAVDVEVTDADGTLVATGRGTYKTSGAAADSPWTAEDSGDQPT